MSNTRQNDRHVDDILRFIAEGTASSTGDDFFKDLTRSLAAALGVKWAFVSEFAEVRSRVRAISFWNGESYAEPFEYDLEHSPCEGVLNGEVGFYPDNVQKLFPLHHQLEEMHAESYLAIPITNRTGDVIGHLAAMDTAPMEKKPSDLAIFKIFGARAGAELERLHIEREVQRSEQRLSCILQTAMDAIITVDEQRRITMFNRAAETMFRCAADWAIGQPIDRFVAKRHRKLFGNFMGDSDVTRVDARQVWIPEGLSASRADGDEFPIEATFSPLQSDGQRFYTFILRDINARSKAEAVMRNLQAQNQDLQEVMRRQQEFPGLIGDDPAMQLVYDSIGQVANTDATVLINGETGAGKELVAQAIHEASSRKNYPLVTVNCAALPADLIESELFGHERGAFTGATNMRKGRFELAHTGTIFLDEIGELTAQAQAKLLRVLQEQVFERVGGSSSIRVDVRVVAATNRDLAEMVAAGTFRADLYYRLNVFPIRVPALRERRGDIPLLSAHFLHKFSRKLGKPLNGIGPVSLERLKRYAWPGNVRELQNVIERAAILATGPTLEVTDALLMSTPPEELGVTSPVGTIDEVTKQHILRTLDDCENRIEGPRGAAAVLGMKPSTLRYRMKQLGISKKLQRTA